MKKRHYLFLSAVMLLSFFFTSCGETDDAADEFENWKERNDTYFNNLYNRAKGGSSDLKVITNWSLNEEVATDADDHIVVQVLEKGTGSGCPMYTDSVRVHYRGRLIPSSSFADGFVFDQSYSGVYNSETLKPASFALNSLVDGFTTAVMNMHIGDHWRVYIPYKLGYGTSSSSSKIPAYSTLIFDIALVAYYRPGTVMPVWKAKPFKGDWTDE
ncbi:MAG: FKBP-type peptidyl-prolyl cis-trans isomerase [Prevotella sp.]|nr:FKBP-type peptidyl-prolyl cis-trans isomerase [Prevotella sp.]